MVLPARLKGRRHQPALVARGCSCCLCYLQQRPQRPWLLHVEEGVDWCSYSCRSRRQASFHPPWWPKNCVPDSPQVPLLRPLVATPAASIDSNPRFLALTIVARVSDIIGAVGGPVSCSRKLPSDPRPPKNGVSSSDTTQLPRPLKPTVVQDGVASGADYLRKGAFRHHADDAPTPLHHRHRHHHEQCPFRKLDQRDKT